MPIIFLVSRITTVNTTTEVVGIENKTVTYLRAHHSTVDNAPIIFVRGAPELEPEDGPATGDPGSVWVYATPRHPDQGPLTIDRRSTRGRNPTIEYTAHYQGRDLVNIDHVEQLFLVARIHAQALYKGTFPGIDQTILTLYELPEVVMPGTWWHYDYVTSFRSYRSTGDCLLSGLMMKQGQARVSIHPKPFP